MPTEQDLGRRGATMRENIGLAWLLALYIVVGVSLAFHAVFA